MGKKMETTTLYSGYIAASPKAANVSRGTQGPKRPLPPLRQLTVESPIIALPVDKGGCSAV